MSHRPARFVRRREAIKKGRRRWEAQAQFLAAAKAKREEKPNQK